MVAGAQFLPKRFPIAGTVGDDLSITFAVKDQDGVDWAWDGSTVVAEIADSSVVSGFTVGPLVDGALSLSMTDAQSMAMGRFSSAWSLAVTTAAGVTRHWLAGSFTLLPATMAGVASTTGATLTVGATGDIAVVVSVGLVGADGVGVPAGGATGQVLSKVSSGDYDTDWITAAGLGDMLKSENLSGLSNVATARTNIGAETAGAAAAAQAASQPLDSDLTAIAALSTTAYGRAFLSLADAAAGRTALGLGTAATQATGAFDAAGAAAAAQAAASAASQPVDSDLTAIAALTTTSFGRSLLTQADASAARTTLGLGSAATTASTAYATAAQGATADTAVQPATLTAHTGATTTVHGIADTSKLVSSPTLLSLVEISQAAYDLLTPVATTIYYITS